MFMHVLTIWHSNLISLALLHSANASWSAGIAIVDVLITKYTIAIYNNIAVTKNTVFTKSPFTLV